MKLMGPTDLYSFGQMELKYGSTVLSDPSTTLGHYGVIPSVPLTLTEVEPLDGEDFIGILLLLWLFNSYFNLVLADLTQFGAPSRGEDNDAGFHRTLLL